MPAPKLRSVIRPHAPYLVVALILSLVAVGASLVQPMALSLVVEAARQSTTMTPGAAVLIAVTALEALALALQRNLLHRVGAQLVFRTRADLVPRILAWPVGTHASTTRGDIVTLVSSDASNLHRLLISGYYEVFVASITFLGALVLMATINLPLLAVTAGSVTLTLVVVLVLSRAATGMGEESQRRTADMTSELLTSLHSLRTLKAAGATSRRASAITRHAQDVCRIDVALGRRMAIVQPLVGLAIQSTFLVVLVAGGTFVTRGVLPLEQLLAFQMYLLLLLMPVESGLRAIPTIANVRASWQRLAEASSTPTEDECDAVARAARPRSSRIAGTGAGALEVRHVTHHHPDGAPALHDLSLDVPPGSRIAIVGASGAGKSTLLGLFLRFADPSSGSIALDGVDLRSLDRSEVRRHVAFLEQRAPVLSGTVADNLRLGAPEAPDIVLRDALTRVGLDHLVRVDGLDTRVGEDGHRLSGGEAQRLALAGVLVRDARVVVVDEPTSQVDAFTERAVVDALTALTPAVTLVVVAHRLVTVLDFDVIVHLDKGTVTGMGTHDELLVTCSGYRNIARLQHLDNTLTSASSGATRQIAV